MAYEPILGKDVLFQIQRADIYENYACAATVGIDFVMETKPTKTIGDGVWKRQRGQALSYTINLEGVIMMRKEDDEEIEVSGSFHLINYYLSMAPVAFRLIFTDNLGNIKVFEGYALPTNISLTGGSEGHATDSVTLEGVGEPDIRDELVVCPARITDTHTEVITSPIRRRIHIDSMSDDSPTITRFDYTVDGGGVRTVFTDGSIPTYFDLPFGEIFSLEIVITPICENGLSGTPYTITVLGP